LIRQHHLNKLVLSEQYLLPGQPPFFPDTLHFARTPIYFLSRTQLFPPASDNPSVGDESLAMVGSKNRSAAGQ
jgi:hypothetical protein